MRDGRLLLRLGRQAVFRKRLIEDKAGRAAFRRRHFSCGQRGGAAAGGGLLLRQNGDVPGILAHCDGGIGAQSQHPDKLFVTPQMCGREGDEQKREKQDHTAEHRHLHFGNRISPEVCPCRRAAMQKDSGRRSSLLLCKHLFRRCIFLWGGKKPGHFCPGPRHFY